jgi:16S rRNA (adenine1518-N6/adenine1519-N6)-dimethyltransferase
MGSPKCESSYLQRARLEVNLTHVPTLKDLLKRHGLQPTKALGQHFLVSEGVVNAIVRDVLESGAVSAFEVGPGPGVLTSRISETLRLVAVELDSVAVSALSETAPSAQVHFGDALEVPMSEWLEALDVPRAIVSNMPYQITAPLLARFTAMRHLVVRATLMMQKEVAEKLLANSGSKSFGSISIFIQSRWQVQKLIAAPAGAFYPPPKVDSLVLSLVPLQREWSPEFDSFHERLVRGCFAQPRKTLANNLVQFGFGRDDAESLISGLGKPLTIRPHELNLREWDTLAEAAYDRK